PRPCTAGTSPRCSTTARCSTTRLTSSPTGRAASARRPASAGTCSTASSSLRDLPALEHDAVRRELVAPVFPRVGFEARRRVLGRVARGEDHGILRHPGKDPAFLEPLLVHP